MSLQSRLSSLITAVGSEIKDLKTAQSNIIHPFKITNRWYAETDNRWVTNSDDQYGMHNANANEDCGTGTDPVIEHEHVGMFLPSGVYLRDMHVYAKGNNTEITEMDIAIWQHAPNGTTGTYQGGLDNDDEFTNTKVFQDKWMTPAVGTAFTGNINDMHYRKWSIDHTITTDTSLNFFMKPTGTITSIKYFFAEITLELVWPQ